MIVFIITFGVETLIALFLHDKIIRPYVGDILVVVLLYAFVRIIIPRKCALLPLYIFLFSAAVEVSQYFNLASVLGLSENRVARTILGSTFDWSDIACYGIGCALLGIYEYFTRRRKKGLYFER